MGTLGDEEADKALRTAAAITVFVFCPLWYLGWRRERAIEAELKATPKPTEPGQLALELARATS